ncbi:cytochrome P450 [Nocardia sp. NPDC001965]
MTQTGSAASTRPHHEVDISSYQFWEKDFDGREAAFARLRAVEGLTWHTPPDSLIFADPDPGFWAVTRYRDVVQVSRNPEIFSSADGTTLGYTPPEVEYRTRFFIALDAPRHTRFRKLISSAFTPRQIQRVEEQVRANATRIVDDFVADLRTGETLDFVEAVSRKLPMQTISQMIGIPETDREAVAFATEALFGTTDLEYTSLEDRAEFLYKQIGILHSAGTDLARRRRAEPRNDLMSAMVDAEFDGHRLSDEDIGAFMVLISAAGNDTTKQTTSHAFKALVEHPDRIDWLREDLDGRMNTAIEEFIRWGSVVVHFARRATRDTEIAGTPIAAGEKVVMFYSSANRDESAFDNPHAFDITRDPNHHAGFGGGGPHHCLGAWLARMELKHLFRELITKVPPVELGEPEYGHSALIHGIKRMTVRLATP